MTAYAIRTLTPDDWQDFSSIRLEGLKNYPHFFGSTHAAERAYTQTDWQNWLSKKDGALFGLYHNNAIIGTTGLITTNEDPTMGLMIASYISPAHQRKGLSSKLYEARLVWAAAFKQWKTLRVSHRDGNEASRRANQKWGFVYIHSMTKTWPDGITADNLYYELDLEQLRQKS